MFYARLGCTCACTGEDQCGNWVDNFFFPYIVILSLSLRDTMPRSDFIDASLGDLPFLS